MAISVPDQWSVHASSPFRQPPDQCRDRDRFAVRVGRPRRGRHDGHAVPPGVLAATRPVDNLQAVAVASPSDAWAVGTYEASGWAHTLIEHWNGTRWRQVASPGKAAVTP